MREQSTRLCVLALSTAILAAACAEPNKYEPGTDPARSDARSSSDAPSGGTSGAGGVGGASGTGGGGASGGTSGTGGSTVMDAPLEAPACTAGATRCAATGATVEVCTVEGEWVMKESCASTCTNGVCTGMCKPAEKHCGANQTPETCSPAGQWVADAMACPNVCTGQGACTGDCKPGTKRCSGPSGLTPETCSETGTWVAATPCANLCSSGSCGGSCPPGTKRCGANQVVETCSAMGTWEPAAQPCPNVCTGNGECGGTCRPGTRQCAALVRQECDMTGAWKNVGDACPNICRDGACTGMCSPGTRRCNPNGGAVQTCAPDASGWTDTETCSGNFACVNGNCSTTQCRSGFTRCGNACITTGTCCRANGCCENSDCGTCQKCVSGSCVNQGSNEDLKNECASATCRTGNCNGNGGCGVSPDGPGSGCNDGAKCESSGGSSRAIAADRCVSGSCQNGSSTDCRYYGCQSNRCNDRCPARNNDTGSRCEPCGTNGARCCSQGAACDSGLNCDNNSTCVRCGGKDQPCCASGNPCNGDGSPGTPGELICYVPTNSCIECGRDGWACCGNQRTAPQGGASGPGACESGPLGAGMCVQHASGWSCE